MTTLAAHVLAMATIRSLEAADWPEVAAIYREGMRDGLATFETEVPSWEAWNVSHLATPRFVACVGDRVAGWAALSSTSTRRVYRGVAEVSVYVARDRRGQGVGRRLLDALVAASERQGIWTLQAGVFPENRASLALHERCGFRVVGIRERLGRRDGIWRDVVLLERRSEVIT